MCALKVLSRGWYLAWITSIPPPLQACMKEKMMVAYIVYAWLWHHNKVNLSVQCICCKQDTASCKEWPPSLEWSPGQTKSCTSRETGTLCRESFPAYPFYYQCRSWLSLVKATANQTIYRHHVWMLACLYRWMCELQSLMPMLEAEYSLDFYATGRHFHCKV